MSFAGAKVLSLESRRAKEIAQLIRNYQGDPFVAPSMREAPLERNDDAFRFAERLFAGEFDMVVLLTGVGTRLLDQVLTTRYPAGRFAEALRGVTVVARWPQAHGRPARRGTCPAILVPEPNTWREVLAATEDRPERHARRAGVWQIESELLGGLFARVVRR
jgi:uroporphyrinogen-III synthase